MAKLKPRAKNAAKDTESPAVTAPAKNASTLTPEERREAYAAKLGQLKQTYGNESLIHVGEDNTDDIRVRSRSTGILSVDRATKIGGFPIGRVVEIYGPESSGKTTLVLHHISEIQKLGGSVAYVDLENALERQHMHNCGVDTLDIVYPENAEQALNMLCDIASIADLVVIDSVSALVPERELEEGMIGDAQPGRQAFLMSQTLRKLVAITAKSGCTAIFINQLRSKIQTMPGASNETTSGGNALKFYSSMRLDMRRIGTEKSGTEAYANRCKVKVVKNKCAPPFGEEEFTMFYDAGRTVAASAIELGCKFGIMEKSGSWYAYKGSNIAQGLPNAVEYLIQNKPVLDEIVAACQDPAVLFKKLVATKQQDVV